MMKLRWALRANKPTEKVKVHRTGLIVERGIRRVEVPEQGIKMSGEAGGKIDNN